MFWSLFKALNIWKKLIWWHFKTLLDITPDAAFLLCILNVLLDFILSYVAEFRVLNVFSGVSKKFSGILSTLHLIWSLETLRAINQAGDNTQFVIMYHRSYYNCSKEGQVRHYSDMFQHSACFHDYGYNDNELMLVQYIIFSIHLYLLIRTTASECGLSDQLSNTCTQSCPLVTRYLRGQEVDIGPSIARVWNMSVSAYSWL